MNPRLLLDFCRSRLGTFIFFVGFAFAGTWLIGRSREQEVRSPFSSSPKNELGRVKIPLNQGLESSTPQKANGGTDPKGAEPSGRIVPLEVPPSRSSYSPGAVSSGSAAPSPVNRPTRRLKPLLAGVAVDESRATEVIAKPFLPFGTLLKCKLVNTVDSSNAETPIIAVLLEDAWQNNERVLSANTLIHGTAAIGRTRDRINASGAWRLVWQDGRELSFAGLPLDREYDHEIDGYGITDGSAGIRGRQMSADDLQEMKLLASAALSGFARGTQQRTETALGSAITGSLSNGVREGIGQVFDLYAQRTLQNIDLNGYFVRIAAGKEFYVYLLENVRPDQARAGNARVLAEPSKISPQPTTPNGSGRLASGGNPP